MEAEENKEGTDEKQSKKKMVKYSTVMIITLIVLLGSYYMVVKSKTHPEIIDVKKIIEDSSSQSSRILQSNIPDMDSVFTVEYLMGKYKPETEPGFVKVELKHGSRDGLYLRQEVYDAFIEMYNAASKDGVYLKIISATRTFSAQKGIWESKWNGSKLVNGKNLALTISDPVERATTILSYSSMPGTSRHHWGTDFDLNSLSPAYFASGAGLKIFDWLDTNASKYGFCRPYTSKPGDRTTGYEEEKWHWSYQPYSRQCLDAFLRKVSYSDIKGFSGSETAEKLDVINNYVSGINKECKNCREE